MSCTNCHLITRCRLPEGAFSAGPQLLRVLPRSGPRARRGRSGGAPRERPTRRAGRAPLAIGARERLRGNRLDGGRLRYAASVLSRVDNVVSTIRIQSKGMMELFVIFQSKTLCEVNFWLKIRCKCAIYDASVRTCAIIRTKYIHTFYSPITFSQDKIN